MIFSEWERERDRSIVAWWSTPFFLEYSKNFYVKKMNTNIDAFLRFSSNSKKKLSPRILLGSLRKTILDAFGMAFASAYRETYGRYYKVTIYFYRPELLISSAAKRLLIDTHTGNRELTLTQ